MVRGLVTAGAVLVSTLAIPGTAHAAGPTVKDAYSDQADWSVIDVRLNYSGEIDKITASLRPVGSGETDTPVATVTDFKQTYYTSSWEGVWSSQPVHLDTLGDYTIDIEATNTAGETTVQKNAGTLKYQKQPVISGFTVTPLTPDIEHRTVTGEGDLVLRDPSTRETVPLPGASVDLRLGQNGDLTVTSDEAGHFSASRELTDGGGWAWATYNGDLGYATVYPWLDIRTQPAKTRFVLDKDKRNFHVTSGQKIAVTGTLQYLSGDQWKPLAGVPVELDYRDGSITDASEDTTDADGRFTLEKYPYGRKTVYEVGFPAYPYNAWIERTAKVEVPVWTTATTDFTEFTARIDEYARLEITGSLRAAGRDTGGSVNVDVQYSADGRTGWTTKKTLRTQLDSQFIVEDLPGHTDGYWRLRYAGSAAKDMKGSVSDSLRRNRALTRVKDGNASPEPVYKGRTITVKGVLQERKVGSTSWTAYGDKKVQILFRPKGESGWYLMSTVTTKASGSFSKGFTAQQDGTWVAVHLYPDGKHFVGSGTEDYVDVR